MIYDGVHRMLESLIGIYELLWIPGRKKFTTDTDKTCTIPRIPRESYTLYWLNV